MTSENRYTTAELEQLADLVAAKVAQLIPQHRCPFSVEDQQFLAGLAATAKNAKKTAAATIVGALALGALSFVGWSIINWLKIRIGAPE